MYIHVQIYLVSHQWLDLYYSHSLIRLHYTKLGFTSPFLKFKNQKMSCYVGTSIGLRRGQPATYRDQIKTHNSHHLGQHFGHKTCRKHQVLRWFKKVFNGYFGMLELQTS